MDELPENWIEKLFDVMYQFYGKKWADKLGNPYKVELNKIIWFNSLVGCTYLELRHGLAVCKSLAKIDLSPPTNVQFWHYCKDIPYPNLHVLRRTSHRHTPQFTHTYDS